MKVLIAIPTYNEAENIERLILEINDALRNHFSYSILVVDDASSDGTAQIVIDLMKKFENLKILQRNGKFGLASAYLMAFRQGIEEGFDAFIEMDADFSHNPSYLPLMFEKLVDYDVVIGSRNIKEGGVRGWSLLRNIISKGGSLYSRIILNCPVRDLTGGFNGWRREIFDKVGLENIISNGYAFQIEMKYRAFKKGAKIFEFPIIFEDRKFGKSKMSKKIFLEALLNVFKIKFLVY